MRRASAVPLLFGLFAFAAAMVAIACIDASHAARLAAEDVRARLIAETARQTSLADADYRARIAEAAAKARFWSLDEPTVFMAQMRGQSYLQDFATAAGIPNPTIVADRPEADAAADVQRLSMTVGGDFDWGSFLAFLSFLEQAQPSMTPTAMDVSHATSPPKFSLTVEMAYLPPGRGR